MYVLLCTYVYVVTDTQFGEYTVFQKRKPPNFWQ